MEKFAAEINNDNIVTRVIVVESAKKAAEIFGGNWVEYKPENNNYPSVGDVYHSDKLNFAKAKPPKDYKGKECNSYILNDNCEWVCAINKPDVKELKSDEFYFWDEEKLKWEIVKVPKEDEKMYNK